MCAVRKLSNPNMKKSGWLLSKSKKRSPIQEKNRAASNSHLPFDDDSFCADTKNNNNNNRSGFVK